MITNICLFETDTVAEVGASRVKGYNQLCKHNLDDLWTHLWAANSRALEPRPTD